MMKRQTSIYSGVPDGGTRAWLICLGSFFLLMNSFGLTNSYGVFQAYYETEAHISSSPSAISWIGSIQSFLLTSLGIVAGPIFDKGHLRALVIGGGLLVVIGSVLTGVSSEYWQVLLAQGVVTGVGSGLLMLPSVAILSQYFQRRLAFATGLATSGSAIGSICYPILFNKLQPRIGFRYTMWIIALVMFFTLSISCLILRLRDSKAKECRIIDVEAWKDSTFIIWAIYLLTSILGLYIPSFYIQLYGEQFMPSGLAFYLLPTMNGGAFLGRIFPPLLADCLGDFNIVTPATVLASMMGFVWLKVANSAGAFTFCFFYGVLIGTITTVVTPIDITLCPNEDVVGARLGMLQIPWAIGLLLGTPAGGAILGQEHRWLAMQVFVGVILFVAAIVSGIARYSRHGTKLKC